VAMFDETDESTGIFKCTNDPPVGKSRFLTNEDLPNDHYLWLTGQAGKLIRGEIPITENQPKRK
ncbi:MAG: xylosidase, partial [Planctomycetes bacterium]|nr:xylosidase [Planctomycetota bacterium]